MRFLLRSAEALKHACLVLRVAWFSRRRFVLKAELTARWSSFEKIRRMSLGDSDSFSDEQNYRNIGGSLISVAEGFECSSADMSGFGFHNSVARRSRRVSDIVMARRTATLVSLVVVEEIMLMELIGRKRGDMFRPSRRQ